MYNPDTYWNELAILTVHTCITGEQRKQQPAETGKAEITYAFGFRQRVPLFLQLADNVTPLLNEVTSHSTTSKVTITWICKPFKTNIHCARCTNVFSVRNLRTFIEIQFKKTLLTKSGLTIRRRLRRPGQ